MGNARLAEDLYIYLTPAGCYHAASVKEEDSARRFLRAVLMRTRTPKLNLENLQELMAIEEADKCIALLQKCQQLGWVQGIKVEKEALEGALEDVLPELLGKISEDGKVVLADDQGFYLSCKGYPHEVAEELSALSAEISSVQSRRSGLLVKNLGLSSHAWGVVNAAGNSQLGFWPLFIGEARFIIAISGIPHFNQNEFISLVWILSVRYAQTK